MDSLKKYNFKDDHGHPLENCQDFIELVHRAESAESSLAAMRQRAEEAEALLARVKRYHELVKDNWLWHIEANAQVGLYEMLNDMEAYLANHKTLSSPPADASKMGGERERLIAAYLAGFEASAEGWNGEYPEGGAKDRRVKEDAEEYARAALAEMEQKS